jgi:arylsulfatase A-like enzyme/cytochrome c-type biogenesis protein CcmH/NrfG
MRRGVLAISLVALAAVTSGCGRDPSPGMNVLILTLDTTRADRLGCYGFDGAVTPNLDRFAAERAVRFEHAMTPIPITLPSHTSIMTGTYPVWHGIHDNDGFFLDDGVTTLAEILVEQGFSTGAVIASFPLDSQFNLDQGFETYNDNYRQDWTQSEIEARTPLSFGFEERRANRVNTAAFRWLDEHADDRFFLWMHYFDPHQSYDPPPPYDTMLPFRYDGEIAFVDENFGMLMDYLREHDLADRTIIVVVGDHGEGLGDHGEPTHASYVYDPTMRVPLLISVPADGFAHGAVAPAQVRTIDIAPTILDLLGLPAHPDMQGESLVPVLQDPSSGEHLPALLECLFPQYHFNWAPLRALRTGQWKYVLAPRPELYDLEADPAETFNVITSQPEVAARLDAELDELFSSHTTAQLDRSTAAAVDADVRAKLEALGYLGGGDANLRAAPFPSRDELATMRNPMDHPLVLDYINFATEHVRLKRYGEAAEAIRLALQMDPDNPSLQVLLGRAYLGLDDRENALAEFERAAEVNPSDPAPHFVMGVILLSDGRVREARESLEVAVRLEPSRVEALTELGKAYALEAKFEEAIDTLRRAVELDDGNLEAWMRLGAVYIDNQQWEEAREALQRARTLDPYSSLVLDKIAILYLRVGNVEFARQVLAKAVETDPENPALRIHLAEALLVGDQDVELARENLEFVLERYPDSRWSNAARERLDRLEGSSDGT